MTEFQLTITEILRYFQLDTCSLKNHNFTISEMYNCCKYVLKIKHIGTWSFLFERWSSGMFFVHTSPPKGTFWDKLSETSFQSASFHSPASVSIRKKKKNNQPMKSHPY